MAAAPTLTVYGATWCPDCRRAKQFLTDQRVPYVWIDLEAHPEAVAEVERRNDGKRIIPTIVFDDDTHLAEPSNDELADKLGLSREAADHVYDTVIVGGGPTGLTTAIYLAREKVSTLVIERSALGGQAGVTERLDNYPGFPDGIAGAELASRIAEQARRYGVELLEAVSVESLGRDDDLIEITLSTGRHVHARSLVLATGSTYRRTGAEGEADLIGAGVHFCATCDGPFYDGAEHVVVIGGGNSALEESLFLTQFAQRVTIIQVSPELSASRLLQDRVRGHSAITVRTSSQVTEFHADETGHLAAVSVSGPEGTERLECAGAFVFVGLEPNTTLVRDLLETDERGFIVTRDGQATSLAGVFAAGDVRSGSTKQMASAVGEGAAVALQIRRYLDTLEMSKGASETR
ncbi:MAG: FAD-dependent oxidoreductase [Acidimicrobiaceae bacterium]|nr:FAD-dependent oxidoreductase [Acidimicrobiaceae bacterium]